MIRIVVFGGSGFVGSHLCERLVAAGHDLIVPTRRLINAQHLLPLPTLDVVETDVHDEVLLGRLLAEADVAINLIGVLHSPSASGTAPYGPAFAKAHVEFPAKLLRACARQGVARLIHISALGADAAAPSEYQRSKAAGENAIHSNADTVAWTILRPSVIFGPGDNFLNLFASLCRAFPILPLGSAQARFQPVYIGNLIAVIEHALSATEAVGQTYEVAGPRVYTLEELVRIAGEAVGRKPLIVALSPGLSMLQAAMLEWLPNPLMSRDNVRSMQRDNVASGAPLPFGMTPTPLEAVIPGYLQGHTSRGGFDALRRQARR